MKIIGKSSLILLLFIHASSYGGDFLKQFVKTDTSQKFFVGVDEEKQKALEEAKKEQADLTGLTIILSEKILRQMDEVKTLLVNVESELQKNPDDDFLINKLTRQMNQVKEVIESRNIPVHAEFVKGDDIPEEIKKKRLQEIVDLQRKHSEIKTKAGVGKTHKVLIEAVSKKSDSGQSSGH